MSSQTASAPTPRSFGLDDPVQRAIKNPYPAGGSDQRHAKEGDSINFFLHEHWCGPEPIWFTKNIVAELHEAATTIAGRLADYRRVLLSRRNLITSPASLS